MTLNELFFAAIFILNCLDIYTTLKILHQGGAEVNPFMSWLMDKVGVIPALLAPKVLFLGACGFYLEDIYSMVLFGMCCFYLLIVLHNFGEVKK